MEHLGVEIFKILKENSEISQKKLMRQLIDMGFGKNKIYIYIRYILAVPLPVNEIEWTEPMIIREAFTTSNTIKLKLNNYWRKTSIDAVIKLFKHCDPDKY